MRLMGKVSHSTCSSRSARAPPTTRPRPTATKSTHRRHRSVHAGPQQPGAERVPSRLRLLRHQPGEPDDLVETTGRRPTASPPTARASRSAAFRSTGTTTCRAIAIRASYTFRDDFSLFLRCRRPSRPEAGRRVPASAGQHAQLQPVRRRHHRQPADRCRPTSRQLFPDAFNADTWNLAAISSITTHYTVGVSD